jgi:hypothetical protein
VRSRFSTVRKSIPPPLSTSLTVSDESAAGPYGGLVKSAHAP